MDVQKQGQFLAAQKEQQKLPPLVVPLKDNCFNTIAKRQVLLLVYK